MSRGSFKIFEGEMAYRYRRHSRCRAVKNCRIPNLCQGSFGSKAFVLEVASPALMKALMSWIRPWLSTCSSKQSFGNLSGRTRKKLHPWRKRPSLKMITPNPSCFGWIHEFPRAQRLLRSRVRSVTESSLYSVSWLTPRSHEHLGHSISYEIASRSSALIS